METILIVAALTIVIHVLIMRGIHKRLRYMERDITSLSKNTLNQALDNRAKSVMPPYTAKATKLEHLEDPKLLKAHNLALDIGWDIIDHQENIKMLRVARQRGSAVVKVNIYYGAKTGARTYTVATALKHPTKGKTQLFRKHVTLEELKEILQNPRAHSGKGYYKKN